MRPKPADMVVRWLADRPALHIFTTTVTQAEIGYALALMSLGKRRTALEAAVEKMFANDFHGRVLSFDAPAARGFLAIAAIRKRMGQPVTSFDAMIAAIARRGRGDPQRQGLRELRRNRDRSLVPVSGIN
jgi:predicted nucleic acid-binding protein